jgi:hypothetical protein
MKDVSLKQIASWDFTGAQNLVNFINNNGIQKTILLQLTYGVNN